MGEDGRRAGFPAGLLAVGVSLTVVLGLIVLRSASESARVADAMQHRYVAVHQLSGTIAHLDEVLTMSARMAAVTGDLAWEDRYLAHVDGLDAAITESRRLAAPVLADDALARTDRANRALVAMETRSFDLVRAGRADAARSLLSGPGYEHQKDVYAAGLREQLVGLERHVTAEVDGLERRAERWAWGAVALLAVLLATWLAVVHRLTRWRRALRSAEAARDDAVRASERDRFRALVRNSTDVIGVVDPDGILTYQSASVETIFGHDRSDVVGLHLQQVVHRDDRDAVRAMLQAPPGAVPAKLIVRLPHRELGWRVAESSIQDRRDDPLVGGFVLNTRDVTEEHALADELRHRASHDELTGLANRARILDVLHRAVSTDRAVGLLVLDLEGLKAINDAYGHRAGDTVLVTVSQRLGAPRPGVDLVGRMGGDEFAMVLSAVDDASVSRLADAVLTELARPIDLPGAVVRVPSVAGISMHVPGPARGATGSADALVRNADLARHSLKRRGGTGWQRFEPAMHTEAVDRLVGESELRTGLERGELAVRYQPTVRLADGCVVGAEALARWQHPRRGLLAPGEFIPLAEETGLVAELGRQVLRQACRQGRRWHDLHPDRALTVAVNLSGHQLLHADLAAEVATALADSGLAPARLVLEVTETVVVADVARAVATLGSLRDLGVRVALDDFGTGYSSLGILGQLPVDILKIDRSFVAEMTRSEAGMALTRAVVELGRVLGLEVLAEGIETPEQLLALERLGCDTGQGYYFAPPVEAAEVEALVERALHPTPVGAGG